MGHMALYNSERPKTFTQIVGAEQEHVITTLKNQIRTGKTAQAYLFCGSRGTGKTTTARVFARAINCQSPVDGCEPCGECPVCRDMLMERTTDLIETDAASNTGVDDMRDLLEMSKYPPTTARYKVYIIDEVHMLSKNASNALLKTLEEPPVHVVFLLCTTEPNRLPATVLSRCQRFDFRRYSVGTIVGQMEKILSGMDAHAAPEALYEIARSAEGGMRDALSLLEQCLSYGEEELTAETVREVIGTSGKTFLFSFVGALLQNDAAKALADIGQLMRDGRDAQAFAREVTGHLRALLVAQALGSPEEIGNLLDCAPDDARQYAEQAKDVPNEKLLLMMERFMDCEGEMRWATQPRNALELCAFQCARPAQSLQLDALAQRVAQLEKQIAQGVALQTAPAPAASAGEKPTFDVDTSPESAKKPAQEKQKPAKAPASAKAALPGEDIWRKAMESIKEESMGMMGPLSKASYAGREGDAVVLEFAKNENMFMKMLGTDAKKAMIARHISKAAGETLGIILREKGTAAKELDPERTATITLARDLFGREHVDFLDE